jgi:signal transduction histidine kinase
LKPLWVLAAVLSFTVLILSLPGYVARTPIGNLGSHLVFKTTTLLLVLHHLNSVISILSAVLSLSLAFFLFIKISDQRMGLFLAFYLLAHGILLAGPIEMLESFWPNVVRVNSFILLPMYAGPATAALIGLFPDGRFVPRWSRWLVPATLLFLLASFLLERGELPLGSGLLGWILTGMVIVLLLAVLAAILYVSIYRYRQVSTSEQRQQTKWVVYGLFLWFVFLFISVVPWMMVLDLPTGSLVPWWVPVAQLFWFLSIAIFPVTLTIAVMRFRLYDIDILINRTLVYGALTISVIAIYTLVVGAASALFQSSGNLVVSLLATGLVAVLFQPLRERLQGSVNRLLYGERANPFAVMTDLARRLENAKNPNDMLVESVRTVGQALKLPYVAIVSGQDRQDDIVAAWGNPAGEPVKFPLIYQAETVGYLLVSPRAPGEAFNEVEQNLLRTIARQAGALVHAVRLTDDLKRSRRRIVSAREEERRRLRRDLHDGLGASLAALHLQTGVLRRLIRKDQDAAEEIVGEFRGELREAIDEIRRVVYELRPPALDELGLIPAIQAQAARCTGARLDESSQPSEIDRKPDPLLQVRVEAPETLPPLPAAVEVAAFRIVQEALTNVVRHARARRCFVRLELDGNLQVEVVDDGVGIKDRHKPGVGLISMCERATELGGTCVIEPVPSGGTRVRACLPLSQE